LKCNAVLRLPGESKGADAEVALAEENGIDVFYSIEDLIQAQVPSCNRDGDCPFCNPITQEV